MLTNLASVWVILKPINQPANQPTKTNKQTNKHPGLSSIPKYVKTIKKPQIFFKIIFGHTIYLVKY